MSKDVNTSIINNKKESNSDLAGDIQNVLAGAANYYAWIYHQFQADIGNNVLEIGCGGGHFTQFLADRPGKLLVADIEQQYLEALNKKYFSRTDFATASIDLNDLNWSDKYLGQFDSVIFLNVLEHIEDDRQVLRQLRQVLRPEGKLMLMVPAFQIIYGSMDAADNHYRRYSKKEVKEKLQTAQFNIKWLRYMNIPGFFAWFINGRILKRNLLPEGQLGLYNQIIPIVEQIEMFLPLPFGQSIISLAEI
ncbi:MAG: ribosomal RNA adenine methylase transferase [bacterium]|nr:MAG: ribosomal RNA adenine methylase transferase [bacterium]